jgi:hypothetical protein
MLGAVFAVLAFAVRNAGAMGGDNLAPDASPYALFSQQIITPLPLEGRSADIGESYQPSPGKASEPIRGDHCNTLNN